MKNVDRITSELECCFIPFSLFSSHSFMLVVIDWCRVLVTFERILSCNVHHLDKNKESNWNEKQIVIDPGII